MVQAKLHLTSIDEGRQFVGQSGSGHQVVMDGAQGNSGAEPIELALLALGGCTAFDVIAILRKMRQSVTGYDIELQAEQRPDPPTVFTHVTIKHKLSGMHRAPGRPEGDSPFRRQVLFGKRHDLENGKYQYDLRDYSWNSG